MMAVYYIGAFDSWDTIQYIKIGYSENPEARLDQLNTASPLQLYLLTVEPGDRSVERARQDQFVEWSLHGEWFGVTDEVRDHCIALGADPEWFSGMA